MRISDWSSDVCSSDLAGVLALGLHYGSYCSEVYRAGLENIPRGQWEASIALNLSPYHTFRDVIIPQAIPPVVPALGNYFVALFKETPLRSEEHTSELQSLMRISYAVFCLKKKKHYLQRIQQTQSQHTYYTIII